MFQRLLIANRGEIAIRIIRACRELGVESVAVYSDVDSRAPHVTAADRAVSIGPAPASQSYLSIPNLLRAARDSGADAVHPGYGFLSENAPFASACESAGVVFVGPPSEVIARMGSKIEARRLMLAAGVPVVPGETPDDQSDAGVVRAAHRVS
ncbi:MAG: biotin carboxylase N-terminal domain-containing protein, partial [Vicinamibacterales bacterium]